MNPIAKTFNRITSKEDHEPEQLLVKHLKMLCALTVATTFFVSLSNNYLTGYTIYSVLSLLAGAFYVVMFILLHFEKNWYKIYFAISMPIWAATLELCIGTNPFGHGILTVSFLVTTFLFFKDRIQLRNLFLVYISALHLGSTIYTQLCGVIPDKDFDFPFDQHIVFVNCILWVIVIFQYYEHKADNYISALTFKNKELKQKRIELERFNYMASHDLKTPIRTITSFLGLINRDIDRNDFRNIKEYSEYATHGAKYMQDLLEGIIEIAAIKTDFIPDELESIDLNILVEKIRKKVSYRFPNKKLLIKSNLLPTIIGIPIDYEIVFEAIIENGLLYNKSILPEVQIQSKVYEEEFIITFRDNGIGISNAYYDQIFHFFKRLHSTKEYPGTGLGLGLCKKIIVDKYEGWIDVLSDSKASTTFILKIPNKFLKEYPSSKQLKLSFEKPFEPSPQYL